MKYLLSLILTLNLYAVKLDHSYINLNYNSLSTYQKGVIIEAYNIGERLIIDGESYGATLATFTLTESSAGRLLTGDNYQSFGLCHLQLARVREILPRSTYLEGYNSLSDVQLSSSLTTDSTLNLILCGLNFKLNLQRWKYYSKAVRAHNGYNPYGNFHNESYYSRFINNMQIVKLVLAEQQEF